MGALRPYSILMSSTPAPADEPTTAPPNSIDPPDAPFASFASPVSSSPNEPALPASTEAARPGDNILRVPALCTTDGTRGVMSSTEKRPADEPRGRTHRFAEWALYQTIAAANRGPPKVPIPTLANNVCEEFEGVVGADVNTVEDGVVGVRASSSMGGRLPRPLAYCGVV
ncbi:hypothetical protein B0H14DRAFT_3441871 [Mycena olivaceomarginata]|nr:hypothetical protein B0H14DRAFT_3441871 [Mycena olivaceomarginata]